MSAFFSINAENLKGADLFFGVYINSSASRVQKFICLFKPGTALSPTMIDEAKNRFHQLYVREEDRSKYLALLSSREDVSLVVKSQAIKDSAIIYLDQVVGIDWQAAKPEHLAACIMQCRDLVSNLIDIIDNRSLDEVKLLLKDLAEHDFYTFDHSINVCVYAIQFYKQIFPQFDRLKLIDLALGALLHDIGKSRTPTAIINKPSCLTVEEVKVIQLHPTHGKEIFLSILHLLPPQGNWHTVLDIIFQHHENMDGSGYPQGLRGQEININAKICMLADIFDALTSKRSYADVLEVNRAFDVMKKMVGKKIDPVLFEKLSPYILSLHHHIEIPTDNLVLHPFFDPSIPFTHIELVQMPVTSYSEESSMPNYGKVIIAAEKKIKKVS